MNQPQRTKAMHKKGGWQINPSGTGIFHGHFGYGIRAPITGHQQGNDVPTFPSTL